MNKKAKLSALIIDDEDHAIKQLELLLAETYRVEVVATLNNSEMAIETIEKYNPILLFLDIQMPHKSGIDLLKELNECPKSPHVVMVTAYNNYMLDALRHNAFDYLLKPVGRDELHQCIDRIALKIAANTSQNLNQLLTSINNKIAIPGVYETNFYASDEILCLKADGRYTEIYLTNGKRITTCRNLGNLADELKKSSFLRVSRSSVINPQYLSTQNHRYRILTLQANGLVMEIRYSKRYLI